MSEGARLSASLAVLIAAGGFLSPSGQAHGPRAAQIARTEASQTPASIVIAEVLFDPAPGEAPFVELLNSGRTAVELTRMALRVGDDRVLLVRVPAPLPPRERLVVRFDGKGALEGRVYHAAAPVTLTAAGGAIELLDEFDAPLDRVAWGDADGAVESGDDDFRGAPPRGQTIGRPPGADDPSSLSDWVVYQPGEATPGAENPVPAVEDLVPMSGAILPGPSLTLHWYPVVGAVTYRAQVARDESFSSPVVDTTVAARSVTTGSLPAGRYLWRVQAIDARGTTARFSAPSRIELTEPAPGGLGAIRPVAWRIRSAASQIPDLGQPQRILPVPLIYQHKDTRMLQLESRREKDPHGWDVDHSAYDADDPSDSHNCVLGSLVMVNRFFKGDLSQDRIGYEVKSRNGAKYAAMINGAPDRAGLPDAFDAARVVSELRERKRGPEWDLTYGKGLNVSEVIAAMTFALGGVPRARLFATREALWAGITAEINAGRPVLSGRHSHMVVLAGYATRAGRRVMVMNDPVLGRFTAAVDDIDPASIDWFMAPASPRGVRQEPSVAIDSDADGIVDFDETERFLTNPKSRDTDGDGVDDKQDIAAGVFDVRYGYAAHNATLRGRDFDSDGIPTERDADSDEGGCRDGAEDEDGDGHRTGRELWNFDDTDDACREVNGKIVWTVGMRRTGQLSAYTRSTFVVTVKLAPEQPGEMGSLVDNGSRYRYHGVSQLTLALDPACTAWARSGASGSGAFDKAGTAIGGTISEEGLVIGANADVPGWSWGDMCLVAGSNAWEGGTSLPECLGTKVGATAYRFSCTVAPAAPPDWEFLEYSMTGRIDMAPHKARARLVPAPPVSENRVGRRSTR